jgi:hypothetical protein
MLGVRLNATLECSPSMSEALGLIPSERYGGKKQKVTKSCSSGRAPA